MTDNQNIKAKFLAEHIGQRVKLILRNDFVYKGEVLAVDNFDILLLECRLGPVTLSIDNILEVQPIDQEAQR